MKVFKGLRIINAPITTGRPQEYRDMINSFYALARLERFRHILSMNTVNVQMLHMSISDAFFNWNTINNAVLKSYADGYMPIVMNGDHS